MGHVWIRDCLEVMPYAAFVRDEKGIDQHLNNKFYAALDIRKYARLKSDGEGFSQDLKEISTLNSPDYFCGTIPVKDHIASCAQKHPIEIDLEFIEPYGL
ncbi:MAG: hypothetical protein LUB61_06575 [Eggerthellaceae bacterium]|nr:hypothetical protein [Eggerthellaceae bacterium]